MCTAFMQSKMIALKHYAYIKPMNIGYMGI